MSIDQRKAPASRPANGGDTAATDYFRAKTTDTLTATFRPVVKDAMDKLPPFEVGKHGQLHDLNGADRQPGFLRKAWPDRIRCSWV